MDWTVNVSFNQQVVDLLGILVLSSVGSAENGADANGVLIDKVDGFLGIDHVAIRRAVDKLLLDIKVAGSLLPADLDRRVHDHVGAAEVLAFGLAFVDPALLHGQGGEHDGFRGADGAGSHGVGVFVV